MTENESSDLKPKLKVLKEKHDEYDSEYNEDTRAFYNRLRSEVDEKRRVKLMIDDVADDVESLEATLKMKICELDEKINDLEEKFDELESNVNGLLDTVSSLEEEDTKIKYELELHLADS